MVFLMRTAPIFDRLGIGLTAGDSHYRAYVGPPQDYDLIAAMTFNLLTTAGLRQHHKLIDVGCGSLRAGRLFIPYLNSGNYIGVEPNEWLVKEAIKHEMGDDLIRIKAPSFIFKSTLSATDPVQADYAVAQSILAPGYFGSFKRQRRALRYLHHRKRRLQRRGLDLSGLRHLSPGDDGTSRSSGWFPFRSLKMAASAPNMGPFC